MQKEFDFVKKTLIKGKCEDRGERPGQQFRTHSAHIARVIMWAKRLIQPCHEKQRDAVLLAATFHDVGYAISHADHAKHSANILREYASENQLQTDVAERAIFLVREHSNKEYWMSIQNAPSDLILLMEADLLDEEGAMGLVKDMLTVGATGGGYEEALTRMMAYEPSRISHNPMMTPLAKKFWVEKQQLLQQFIRLYTFDMENKTTHDMPGFEMVVIKMKADGADGDGANANRSDADGMNNDET